MHKERKSAGLLALKPARIPEWQQWATVKSTVRQMTTHDASAVRPGRKQRSEATADERADKAVRASQRLGCAPFHVSRFTFHASTRSISRRFNATLALTVFLLAGPAARGFVYETEQQ